MEFVDNKPKLNTPNVAPIVENIDNCPHKEFALKSNDNTLYNLNIIQGNSHIIFIAKKDKDIKGTKYSKRVDTKELMSKDKIFFIYEDSVKDIFDKFFTVLQDNQLSISTKDNNVNIVIVFDFMGMKRKIDFDLAEESISIDSIVANLCKEIEYLKIQNEVYTNESKEQKKLIKSLTEVIQQIKADQNKAIQQVQDELTKKIEQILDNHNKLIQQKDDEHKQANEQLLIEKQNAIQQLQNEQKTMKQYFNDEINKLKNQIKAIQDNIIDINNKVEGMQKLIENNSNEFALYNKNNTETIQNIQHQIKTQIQNLNNFQNENQTNINQIFNEIQTIKAIYQNQNQQNLKETQKIKNNFQNQIQNLNQTILQEIQTKINDINNKIKPISEIPSIQNNYRI